MFTRRLPILAALGAASLFFTPGGARAQVVFFGGNGGIFGSPLYSSPYMSIYRPGWSTWSGWGGYASPFAYGNFRPGYGGYPYGYGGYPYGYGGYMAPGLYPGYAGYPGYRAYPGYGSYPGYSSSGMATLPYTPGLDLNYLSPGQLSGGSPRAPREYPDPGAGWPRARATLNPAVAVAPGSTLVRDRLGRVASGKAPARVEVRVPAADAKVWFQGQPTKQTGKVREFESPPLTPGTEYTYRIRATWLSGGKEVTRNETVTIHSGARVQVDFTSK
jgi:uncharacterized protein (TIGR03000 family)